MTFSSPLTRSALRKLAHETQPLEPQKLKLSGAAVVSSDDASASVSGAATAAGVHKRTGTDRELLIQEYATYQHGLTATKRRRALPMSPKSTSQGARDATEPASAAEPASAVPAVSADSRTEPSAATSTTAPSNDAASSPAAAASPPPPATLEIAVSVTPSTAPAMSVAVATLSSEEKCMDGAPEGELFLVTVLAREEIEASADVVAEARALAALLDSKAQSDSSSEAADSAVSWGREYAALDSVRRFAIHHPEQLQQLVARALPLLVCPAVSSLRSAMTRNALLCIQDVILCLQDDVTDSLDAVLPLLLNRAASEKQFIRDLAREVLDSAVKTCANEAMLLTLLRMSVAEKNPQAVNVIGVYVHKCIARMDRALLADVVLEQHASFVDEMRTLLSCKVIECKAATRKSLQHTRQIIGDTKFVELVKSKLSGSAQFDVLRASELKSAAAKPAAVGAKLSMRERMLQVRKQQAARNAASSDVFDVVVAAPPPHARSVSS